MGRRTVLKGAAALAGAARRRGNHRLPGGHRRRARDAPLPRHRREPVADIAKKAKEDLGINIEYVPVTTDDVAKRIITQPNSFDIVDSEYFSLKKLMPSGNLLGMDAKKIKLADKITPVFTKGEVAGKKIGDQGTAPNKVFYLEGQNAKKFAASPTEWITLIPTTYNADTLGIRPDLIKRPIESWTELLNPEFKGKASILNIPSIGIMDAAMVIEATGKHKYADKGNMTKDEIDLTITMLIEAKKAGPVPRLLEGFQRERQPDGLGRDGDPVHVVAGRDQGALARACPACTSRSRRATAPGPPASACRRPSTARSSTRPTSSSTGSCPAGPAPTSTARATTPRCSRPRRRTWSPTSGPTGWKASPPRRTSRRRTARIMEKAGAVRDGGSYDARMGSVACWNAIMDENDYMVRKWNEFIAA